ncbi:hypothetical protein LWX53_08970 [bacterium]|nr:hypothetical protein [bacterium]
MKARTLFFILLASAAWADDRPRSGVSASISIGEAAMGISFGVRGAAASAGAGFEFAFPEMAAESPYAEFESGGCAAYVGIGRFAEGRALRNLPESRPAVAAAKLWARGSGSGGALSVFGLAVRGLRFVVLADASGGETSELSERFRFCGAEVGAALGDRCVVDGGIALAAAPGGDSGDGWRRGAAWRPATSILSAAVAARYAGNPLAVDAWLSCAAGSLAEPAAAFSLRLAANGAASSASLGLFAASGRFRAVLAEPPSRDFIADAKVGLTAGPWRLALEAVAASLFGDGAGAHLTKEEVSSLERLLWQWRVDMAAFSIEAAYGKLSLRARGSADSDGPREGLMALRLALPDHGGRGVAVSGALSARFARPAASASSSGGEEEEGEWGDEDDDEYAAVEAKLEDFALRSLRCEGSVSWRPQPRRAVDVGEAKLSLSARRGEGSWGFALGGALSQSFVIPRAVELKLRLQSPPGGYALERPPEKLPRLSLDCAFPL